MDSKGPAVLSFPPWLLDDYRVPTGPSQCFLLLEYSIRAMAGGRRQPEAPEKEHEEGCRGLRADRAMMPGGGFPSKCGANWAFSHLHLIVVVFTEYLFSTCRR